MSAKCYWITGLSAAGKTTLASRLVKKMRQNGDTVVLLDGDELRAAFNVKAYSREERLDLGRRYAGLCRVLTSQGVSVVIGVIGLFRELHEWNRENIPGYVEIFLDVPMEELRRRDPKKIYERAAKGELKNVAGVDLSVDFPTAPDVHLVWKEGDTPERLLEVLVARLFGNQSTIMDPRAVSVPV